MPGVQRVVCAIDCGTALNPCIAAKQMEDAVVFATLAAFYGQIDIEDGRVQPKKLSTTRHVKTGAKPAG